MRDSEIIPLINAINANILAFFRDLSFSPIFRKGITIVSKYIKSIYVKKYLLRSAAMRYKEVHRTVSKAAKKISSLLDGSNRLRTLNSFIITAKKNSINTYGIRSSR